MKKFPSLLLILVFISGFVSAQKILQHFRFDDSKYYYFKEPGRNGSLNINVTSKMPGVFLLGTDNDNERKLNSGDSFKNGNGKPFYLIAVPALYQVSLSSGGNLYKFGENAGEENFNSAEVTVLRSGKTASPVSVGKYIKPPVKVSFSENDFFADPSTSAYANQQFLKVVASETNTAEIQINRQAERGNVFVCIFNEKGEFLAGLNPKDPNDSSPTKSFVTEKTVYVIPIIGSKFTRQASTDLVQFEVGDPKEVATVEIEEE